MKLVNELGRITVEGDFIVEESLTAANNPIFSVNEPFKKFNIEPSVESGELKITLKYDRTGGETLFDIYIRY